jgi:hypothetical protein
MAKSIQDVRYYQLEMKDVCRLPKALYGNECEGLALGCNCCWYYFTLHKRNLNQNLKGNILHETWHRYL